MSEQLNIYFNRSCCYQIQAQTIDSRRIISTVPDLSYFLNSMSSFKIYATWPDPIRNRSTTGTSSWFVCLLQPLVWHVRS